MGILKSIIIETQFMEDNESPRSKLRGIKNL